MSYNLPYFENDFGNICFNLTYKRPLYVVTKYYQNLNEEKKTGSPVIIFKTSVFLRWSNHLYTNTKCNPPSISCKYTDDVDNIKNTPLS